MSDQPTDDPTPVPRVAGIIWGAPKSGKTVFAASSPNRKWIINLDPEGWTSVASRPDKTVWDYSDLEPKQLVTQMLKIGDRISKADIQSGDTVLFDSVTVMNHAGLLTAIANDVGASNKFTPSIEAPGISAYGARTQYLIAVMGQVIRATRRKGAHVWFLAHEDTPERNEKGEFLYQSILMSENAVNQASAAISEIWRLSENDNARTLQIRSSSRYKPCGTRMFRTDEKREFSLKYNPDKPDLDQPHSIASLWQSYIDGGQKKLSVPT